MPAPGGDLMWRNQRLERRNSFESTQSTHAFSTNYLHRSNYRLRSHTLQSESRFRESVHPPRHPPRTVRPHHHQLHVPTSANVITNHTHPQGAATPSRGPPRSAVIEVPVKKCCELDTEMLMDAPVIHPTPRPTRGGDVRRHKSSAGFHHRTEVAPSGDVDEGGEGPSGEASCEEYVDEKEGENAGIGTLTARGRTMPWDRQYTYHSQMGDDELMMYASLKDNPQMIHLPRRKGSLLSRRGVYQRRTFQCRSVGRRRLAQGVRHARSGEDGPDLSSASPPSYRYRFLDRFLYLLSTRSSLLYIH
ncbi:hypothetical protein BJV78DRAFT_94852 [Lactifluus subvellereus]|nr:hypothetical protein BJV78DRAFT_94852 [Lactifluus subvellereus]